MKTPIELFEEKRDKFIALIPQESTCRFEKHKLLKEKQFEKSSLLRNELKIIREEKENIYNEIMEIYDSEPISTTNISLKKEILTFVAKLGYNYVEYSINQAIKKQVKYLNLQHEIAFENKDFENSVKNSDEAIKLIAISNKPLDYFL